MTAPQPTPLPPAVASARTYARIMALARWVQGKLGAQLVVGGNRAALHSGDIFLFNHFTRFETLYPPPLIFAETGAITLSVAHHSLYGLTPYLDKFFAATGVLPTNHASLLPTLAAEILRGHKVVLFPEGGLVKDKQLFNERGEQGVYSGAAGQFRKHHRGAAALALMLDVFKLAIADAMAAGDTATLDHWVQLLGFEAGEAGRARLLFAAAKPTQLVPSTITFFPIRTRGNWITAVADLVGLNLSDKARDELTLETNLLLKKTWLNLHLGEPLATGFKPGRGHRLLIRHALKKVQSFEDIFNLRHEGDSWLGRVVQQLLDRQTDKIRDRYMRALYAGTTVNVNHVIATLIEHLRGAGVQEIPARVFYHAVYGAVKRLQARPDIHLHLSLKQVNLYSGLHDGTNVGLVKFLGTLTRAKLLKIKNGLVVLSGRLNDAYERDEIRLENPVRLHANEATAVPQVRLAVVAALSDAEQPHVRWQPQLAEYLQDDEQLAFAQSRARYPRRELLNAESPTLADAGQPYVLTHPKPAAATVLVHGLGSTPAQQRALATALHAARHTVVAVRLPGHGSAPAALRSKTATDWLLAAQRGLEIARGNVPPGTRINLVGFSTGGLVALNVAADDPTLHRVVAVAPALQLVSQLRHLLGVGLLVNKILGGTVGRVVPALRHGLIPWYALATDQTHFTYPKIPLESVRELNRLARRVHKLAPHITQPVLLVHGLADTTANPAATPALAQRLTNPATRVQLVEGAPHVLIRDDHYGAISTIVEYLTDAAR